MRLIDELRQRIGNEPTPATLTLLQRLQGAEVVSFDNVTEYFFAVSGQEDWSTTRDFPNVIPPFQNLYMETERPTHINSDVYGRQVWQGIDQWGFHFRTKDLNDDINEKKATLDGAIDAAVAQWNKGHRDDPVTDATKFDYAREWLESRWVVRIMSFYRVGTYFGTVGTATMVVKNDGRPLRFPGNYDGEAWRWEMIPLDPDPRRIDVWSSPEMAREIFRISLHPALLALSFMHCKNVVLVDGTIPRQQRRHAERHGLAVTKFRTIRVAPIEAVLKHRGPGVPTGATLSLHIARGHMKDYRRGNGLFGKYKGLYYWNDQVRGHPEAGVIEKDYEVFPEKEKQRA